MGKPAPPSASEVGLLHFIDQLRRRHLQCLAQTQIPAHPLVRANVLRLFLAKILGDNALNLAERASIDVHGTGRFYAAHRFGGNRALPATAER